MTKGTTDHDATEVDGHTARSPDARCGGFAIGAIPIVNRMLQRIQLERLLR